MTLAGAEVIAARVHPPGEGGNIVSLGHLRLKILSDSFLLTMFIKENIFK